MAIANKIIKNIDTILLDVPASQRLAVTTIMVCNTYTPNPASDTEGSATFDLHFVPSGSAKNVSNMVIKQLTLPAGETFTFDSEKIVLEESDEVVLVATQTGTNIPVTSATNGTEYKIVEVGTTDFTVYGAADNNVDTIFTMTNAPATGTGVVVETQNTSVSATISYLDV